jgi:GDP-4-dehydro-6-deoxy-D-mannose reductase
MRALVTGITGFVGGHLAEHLLAAGDAVVGCSRSGRWPDDLSHLESQAELVACELGDPKSALRLVAEHACDAVFHLAGLANPRACLADPERAGRENVFATLNLCEAIGRSGQRPRLLFVSSAYVYGQPKLEHVPVTEDCPHDYEHPYAATKMAAEQVVTRYSNQYDFGAIRVRPFNHTGPRQPAGYVVPDWARQIAAIEAGRAPPQLLVGNLDTRRDYTDVRDVVRAYRLLAMGGCIGMVYNLGSGVATSGQEIVDRLRQLSRVPWDVVVDPARARSGEAAVIVSKPTPLGTNINWRPEIDLDTTLRDTLDYWRGRQGGTP